MKIQESLNYLWLCKEENGLKVCGALQIILNLLLYQFQFSNDISGLNILDLSQDT